MTKSINWMEIKNSAFALILASVSLATVNNLALADSEAGYEAGSQAETQNSDQSMRQSGSSSSSLNSHESSGENSSFAGNQNNSEAHVEAGRPRNGNTYNLENSQINSAPFAVGQERKNLLKQNDAMPKATEAPPKAATPRSASHTPKPKVVTYHWGRSSHKVAGMSRNTR